jgi:hypothetical protein
MKRRDMLRTTAAAAAGLSCFPLRWVAAAEKKPQKVLYFTRNVGYEHSVVHRKGDELSHSEKALQAMGRKAGIDVVCSKDGRIFDGDIDQFDAFAFYCNNDLTKPNKRDVPPMSAEGKQRLLEAIAGGKGFVGFHSTCACWRTGGNTEIDPFLQMLGGEFISHGPQQVAPMRVASSDFPGMDGFGKSIPIHDEWYALKNFADDLHVILVQDTEGMKGKCYQRPPYPATWARRQGNGRVFYTSMGHPEKIWLDPRFEQIVLGGLAWALGNVEADVTPNIDRVTPKADQWKS